jgi:hypothetical protein
MLWILVTAAGLGVEMTAILVLGRLATRPFEASSAQPTVVRTVVHAPARPTTSDR